MPWRIQFSTRRMLLGVTLVAFWLAVVGYFIRVEHGRQAESARLAKLNEVTVAEVVKEVEAILARLGRSPHDQDELEAILGRPMPVVHDGIRPTPIFYHRTGKNDFKLQYELWDTDDWVYDSTAPQAGWVQHYYCVGINLSVVFS